MFVNTNANFLKNDYMNDYTPKSIVVLAEMNEPVIKQSMDETRNDVVILDTPQDSTHEMSSTQVPRHSGRIVRPPIRFIGLEKLVKLSQKRLNLILTLMKRQ